jgi:cobalt-zinc-cadmium efflux system outer membrane protein
MARALTLLGLASVTGCFHAAPYSPTATQATWRSMRDSSVTPASSDTVAKASGPGMTADEAYAMAIERNYAIVEQSAAAEIAAAEVHAEKQIDNPQLRLTGFDVDDVIERDSAVNIGLRVPIPRPGSVRARVAGAKQVAEGEAQLTEDAKRQLRAEIDRMFAQLAVHRADREHVAQAQALQTAYRDEMAARADQAIATRIDVAMADVRLTEAVQAAEEIDDAILEVEGQLRLLIGANEPVRFATDARTLEVITTPVDRDALVERALEARPELRATHAAKVAAESEVYVARGEAYPWFDWAQLQYRAAQGSPPTAFGFGVAINLPIFSWNRGAIRTARATVRQREREEQAQILGIAAEVTEAAGRVERTAKRIDKLEHELLPQLEAAAREIEAAGAAGVHDPSAANDVDRRTIEARRMHLAAVLAHREAVIDLEAAVGGSIRRPQGDRP